MNKAFREHLTDGEVDLIEGTKLKNRPPVPPEPDVRRSAIRADSASTAGNPVPLGR